VYLDGLSKGFFIVFYVFLFKIQITIIYHAFANFCLRYGDKHVDSWTVNSENFLFLWPTCWSDWVKRLVARGRNNVHSGQGHFTAWGGWWWWGWFWKNCVIMTSRMQLKNVGKPVWVIFSVNFVSGNKNHIIYWNLKKWNFAKIHQTVFALYHADRWMRKDRRDRANSRFSQPIRQHS
jgi:hypothetical protein